MISIYIKATYCRMAIECMKHAATKDDLLAWWRVEKTNRDRWELSPTEAPGSMLKQEFETALHKLSNGE